MEQESVFCPNCGTPSPSDTRFCHKCGSKLPDTSASAKPPGPTSEQESIQEPTSDSTKQTFETAEEIAKLDKTIPESDVDEKFLKGYSFGPGCGFYLLNRIFWPLFLIGVVLNSLDRALESAAQNPYSDASTQAVVSVMLILVSIAGLVLLGVFIWLGTVARRKRWERLKWKSFSQFRSDEKRWNIYGIIGWVLTVIFLVVSFAIGFAEGLQEPYY